MASEYVSFDDFDCFLKERKEKYNEGITPWFKLLVDRSLKKWWSDIIEKGFHHGTPDEAHTIIKF